MTRQATVIALISLVCTCEEVSSNSTVTGPRGKYAGSVKYEHKTISAEFDFTDTVSVKITGFGSLIDCSAEDYDVSRDPVAGTLIAFRNLTDSGDCVHDAFAADNIMVDAKWYYLSLIHI